MSINMKSSLERFKSFVPMLKVVCKIIKPRVVVEYGPGTSTQCFLDYSDANIYAWESHSSFYTQAKQRFSSNPRAEITLGDTRSGSGHKGVYVNAPFAKLGAESADIVFVDGRHRADCMICSSIIVKSTGVVILHDDERAIYDAGRNMFSHSFRDKQLITGLYANNDTVINVIKEAYSEESKELKEYA